MRRDYVQKLYVPDSALCVGKLVLQKSAVLGQSVCKLSKTDCKGAERLFPERDQPLASNHFNTLRPAFLCIRRQEGGKGVN